MWQLLILTGADEVEIPDWGCHFYKGGLYKYVDLICHRGLPLRDPAIQELLDEVRQYFESFAPAGASNLEKDPI